MNRIASISMKVLKTIYDYEYKNPFNRERIPISLRMLKESLQTWEKIKVGSDYLFLICAGLIQDKYLEQIDSDGTVFYRFRLKFIKACKRVECVMN